MSDAAPRGEGLRPGVRLRRIWSDDDLVELEIDVCDGEARFVCKAYTTAVGLEEARERLAAFAARLPEEALELGFGAFGAEAAGGAFLLCLRASPTGRLFVSTRQESDFGERGGETVASSATLHLTSEPALLDRFVAQLGALARDGAEAFCEVT